MTDAAIIEAKHIIWATPREIHCAVECPGPEPHLKEFRAARVQPTTEQTMAYRARDAAAAEDFAGG